MTDLLNEIMPEGFGGGAALIDVTHVAAPADVKQTLQRARIDAAGAPVPQTPTNGGQPAPSPGAPAAARGGAALLQGPN